MRRKHFVTKSSRHSPVCIHRPGLAGAGCDQHHQRHDHRRAHRRQSAARGKRLVPAQSAVPRSFVAVVATFTVATVANNAGNVQLSSAGAQWPQSEGFRRFVKRLIGRW